MKDEEIASAQKNGVQPKEIVIAYDGLAIYVPKDNPIAQIALDDLNLARDGGCDHRKDVGKDGKFTNTLDQSGTEQVVVCSSKEKGGACAEPTVETVKAGSSYPFGRALYAYANGEPTGATKEFLCLCPGRDARMRAR